MSFHGLTAYFFLVLNIVHGLDIPQFIYSHIEVYFGGFQDFVIMNKATTKHPRANVCVDTGFKLP